MSTGDAIEDVIEPINDNIENLKKCSVVSIDLKKHLIPLTIIYY